MERNLQDLLKGVVVTPFDEEITNRLTEVCNIFAKELTVKTIDSYIIQFIYNKPDKDFKKKVEAKYSELYPDEESILLPPLFAIVLSQYIVMIAFESYLKDRDLATCSLILMNYMLIRKGSLVRLILPFDIKKMFFKLEAFIDKVDDIELARNYYYARKILENKEYILNHISEDGLKEEVRGMVKEMYLFRRYQTIQKIRNLSNKHPYSKVYKGLAELFDNTNWLFVKNNAVEYIKKLISVDILKKTSTIDNIVSELRGDEVTLPYEKYEASSIILGFVSSGIIPSDLKNRRLTVLEFGIYVYYELMLEHIINEYYA